MQDPPFKLSIIDVVRFALEVGMLAGVGAFGWFAGNGGWTGGLLVALCAAGAGAIWGIFRVPADSPRGHAPVAVPRGVRFGLEALLFALATYGIWSSWSRAAAETFLTITVVHYALDWERTGWLLGLKPRSTRASGPHSNGIAT